MPFPLCKCSVKHANKQHPATLRREERNFVGNKADRRMNTELYEQVRKGITHDDKGNPIRVTDAEMAEFVVESTKRKWKKNPQIFKTFVLLRHITATTPYGCARFKMVKPTPAEVLTTDPTPKGEKTKEGAFDWVRYELPRAPVGVSPKAKKDGNGNV